jgi:hypothetical protein
MSSEEALDFLFFVNELNAADAISLRAATILAEAKLNKGSRIDIFADGTFWAAKITSVSADEFAFRYCGVAEGGSVHRKDFHKTWRFPVEDARQVALAEALAMVMV